MDAVDTFVSIVKMLTPINKNARRRILLALLAFFGEDAP